MIGRDHIKSAIVALSDCTYETAEELLIALPEALEKTISQHLECTARGVTCAMIAAADILDLADVILGVRR